MLIKKEKIEDLEFMEVEPEDEELRAIVMEEEDKAKKKAGDIALFLACHIKHPSHGYRWLNAKIRLEGGDWRFGTYEKPEIDVASAAAMTGMRAGRRR